MCENTEADMILLVLWREGLMKRFIARQCRNHDSRVSNRVVSAEQPDSPNIGISLAMAPQDYGTAHVYGEGYETKAAHQHGPRHLGDEHAIEHDSKDAQSHTSGRATSRASAHINLPDPRSTAQRSPSAGRRD